MNCHVPSPKYWSPLEPAYVSIASAEPPQLPGVAMDVTLTKLLGSEIGTPLASVST